MSWLIGPIHGSLLTGAGIAKRESWRRVSGGRPGSRWDHRPEAVVRADQTAEDGVDSRIGLSR